MKKKIGIAIIAMLSIIGLVACTASTNNSKDEEDEKVKVITSIYPLREFTQIIGGDKVSVKSMVPEGAEPHDFEPKAKEIVALNSSSLFIYNGLGMESWVDKVLGTVENKNLVVVNASDKTNVIEVDEYSHEGETEEEHAGHDHGRQDPHIWLSLQEVKNQALVIEEGLIKVDPSNKDYYENNYKNFVLELDNLYKEYSEKFKTVSNKDFITGHAAFAYLCRDFGLKQQSVEDIFGEGEITPQHLKELVQYCKDNNIKVIFMPDTTTKKVSETLANEVGAKVVEISSLETQNGDKTYVQTMRENLETIYNNLK